MKNMVIFIDMFLDMFIDILLVMFMAMLHRMPLEISSLMFWGYYYYFSCILVKFNVMFIMILSLIYFCNNYLNNYVCLCAAVDSLMGRYSCDWSSG